MSSLYNCLRYLPTLVFTVDWKTILNTVVKGQKAFITLFNLGLVGHVLRVDLE